MLFFFRPWLANLLETKFLPLFGEFKSQDIHFLDVWEKETIFLVSVWSVLYEPEFFSFEANCQWIKSVREMTAIIFKRLLSFCLKEPLIACNYMHVMFGNLLLT